jgi:hypothetical protein
VRTSQEPGQRYVGRMLEHMQAGELDTSFLNTHRMPARPGARGYEMFKEQGGRLSAGGIHLSIY